MADTGTLDQVPGENVVTADHVHSDGEERVVSPKAIKVSVSPTDFVGVVQRRGGAVLAIDKSHPDSRKTAAERMADGSISIRHVGGSPPGETNTQRACYTLVKRLYDDGENWQSPLEVQDDNVDCIAYHADDPDCAPLQIQHVRVIVDQTYHKRRGRAGGVEDTVRDEVLVENIREAIEKKLPPDELVPVDRPDLILLVDAMNETEHVMGAEELFRHRYAEWLRTLDPPFKAVWLVGPTPSLTFRLDAGVDE